MKGLPERGNHLMNFVAVMGSQVMAVLNPILALLQQESSPKPRKISLLATGFVRPQAETIRRFLLESNLFAEDQIHLYDISDSLAADPDGLAQAPEMLKRLQAEGNICFNIAGGMNFQSAACMRVLDLERCLIVYPEAAGIHLFQHIGGNLSHRTIPLPSPVSLLKLLSLQEVQWEQVKEDKTPALFKEALTRSKFVLPKEALRGVRLRYGKGTGGNAREFAFDLVVNLDNRLHFLTSIKNSKKNKENARQVMAIAADRGIFGHLYDREIYVLTDSEEVAERLKSEAGHKIRVVYMTTNNDFFKIEFARFFNATAPAIRTGKTPEPIETGKKNNSSVVLYTAIGPNLAPTLIAIWSHLPRITRLVYTPEDSEVLRIAESLTKFSERLPTNRIEFIPVSFGGAEILEIPAPEPGTRAEVNITPGTKSQGALLALWARMHGGKSFSIDRGAGRIAELGSNAAKSIRAPKPADFLLLKGIGLKKEGKSKVNTPNNAGIYRFLTAVASSESHRADLEAFPESPVKVAGEFYYEPKENTGRGTITENGKHLAEFSFKSPKGPLKGLWFEEVVGYALEQNGAGPIQLNIETAWEPETERKLRSRYDGQSVHQSEMDVVACFEGEYHIFSCKSTEKKDVSKNAREASAQVSLFGRTAVPYLIFLRYWGDPYLAENTLILGIKTLTEPGGLASLMREELKRRQTTGRRPASRPAKIATPSDAIATT